MPQKKRISRLSLACWLLCLLPVQAFVPCPQHTITLRFRHKVGNQELKLFDKTYTNSFGEPMTLTHFKYYISHVRVTGVDGMEKSLMEKPCLVDEADTASKTLVFPSSVDAVQFLSFDIGVDSLLNVSGAQTGDLDPLKGMFWTWNSGYIFAKLEGRSDSSHAPAHYFNWDIGGYKPSANASRKIKLTVPAQAGTVMVIDADLLKWFDGPHTIKISQHPLCHQPGELAMQIADNYSAMFSIAP